MVNKNIRLTSIVLSVLLLVVLVISATSNEGTIVEKNTKKEINGVCVEFDSYKTANGVFVPVEGNEWNSFRNNLPEGVSVFDLNTCGSLGYNCGSGYDDGCGGMIDYCGSCAGCRSCVGGSCVDDDDNCAGCKSCVGGSCVDDDDNCPACSSYEDWYCQDDSTRARDRTCYTCSSGSCNPYTDTQTSSCSVGQTCSDGSCEDDDTDPDCYEDCFEWRAGTGYECTSTSTAFCEGMGSCPCSEVYPGCNPSDMNCGSNNMCCYTGTNSPTGCPSVCTNGGGGTTPGNGDNDDGCSTNPCEDETDCMQNLDTGEYYPCVDGCCQMN